MGMGLEHADFALAEEQLARINQYFQEQAQAYADAGEDSAGSAHVTFVWMPGFGRSVTAYFDDGIVGCKIEWA